MNGSHLCWLCCLDNIPTPLDAESKCPMHGLVKDRVLCMIQVDVKLLKKWADGAPTRTSRVKS